MHSRVPPLLMFPACARKRLAGAIFASGMSLAIVVALHPATANAQSWAQLAPAATVAESSEASAPPPPPSRPPPVARQPKTADFQQKPASAEVTHVAHWVLDSGDNAGMPYMIVDKVNAEVFVFDAGGRLKGVEPALLGMVAGDRSAEGIGEQKLSAMRPEDRITPAGRFVASIARDLQGQDILWIDYASALALHRVVKGKPSERRAERLQSATSQDNRVSFGCINVPVTFFEKVVSPTFTHTNGVVYILPEMGTASELFGTYEVGAVGSQAKIPAQL